MMSRNSYARYYCVSKNDTVVTQVSANDFVPVLSKCFSKWLPVMTEADACGSFSCFEYSLVPMTRCFMDINKATMGNAKAGADIY